jgi:hypothetical protein
MPGNDARISRLKSLTVRARNKCESWERRAEVYSKLGNYRKSQWAQDRADIFWDRYRKLSREASRAQDDLIRSLMARL